MHHRSDLPFVASLVFAALAVGLAACSKSGDTQHAENHRAHHAHTAPHGGTLVEIGEHAFNLEFVRDAAAGRLTAYVLDGHAENFVRIAAPAFELVASIGGERRALAFRPAANAATGETVGDSAQFDAHADWLKSAPGFEGTIPEIDIRGTAFRNVAVRIP